MEEINFKPENVSCFSLELHWSYNSKEKNDIDNYKIYQKEGGDHYFTNYLYFEQIYEGKKTDLKIKNLKQNQQYTFKLEIIRKEKKSLTKNIVVNTLKVPSAFISIQSLEITNGGKIIKDKERLQERQKNIIGNCSQLIFSENDDNVLKGSFDGIIIKLTHEVKDDIYYMSFDIEPDYYNEFMNQYLKECISNVMMPCHFIFPKLPNVFILDLLERATVIFTGSRMGGVIASSLAFYIMYIGKKMNFIYGNAFEKSDINSLGVVTFGSPVFLSNISIAFEMKSLSSFFYNIKGEFDFIPEIIDYIGSNESYFDNQNKYLKDINLNELINIFNKVELNIEEIKLLDKYLKAIYFTEYYVKKFIETNKKIPFGYYFDEKISDSTSINLIPIYEDEFMKFYYLNKFEKANNNISNLKIYKRLVSVTNFSKKSLEYLINKENKLEIIKIIRRNNKSNKEPNSIKTNEKLIIKFEFKIKGIHYNMTPDIIKKIELFSSDKNKITISSNDIFYDNDKDITAYIDVSEENTNIKDVTIITYFSGEIKSEYILNIKGSGKTRDMLYNNLEKLFLIPFFKLFEIFYISKNDEETYKGLKQENFGSNFNDLKILKSFGKQINAIDELLLFTRPDLLCNKEKQFFKSYIENDLNALKDPEDLDKKTKEDIIKSINIKLTKYYEKAKILQKEQNFNCINPEKDSIAEKNSFPLNFEKKEIKKLFMCKFDYSDEQKDNIVFKKFDNSYIKDFIIENCLSEVLNNIEKQLKENLNNLDENDIKDYLNNNIGKYYDLFILPNIYLIRMLILVSIEGGDQIKFCHKFDWQKFKNYFKSSFKLIINFLPSFRNEFFENDFVKIFSKEKIENIHMKNFFFKRKTKKIVKSNIDSNDFDNNNNQINAYMNKIKKFSIYSENKDKNGNEYYEAFLQLLNNYSNDFPEDIETSIFDNLKENFELEFKKEEKKNDFTIIMDLINDNIYDEEGKKGFLALLKQSYLIGKLRSNIVSIFYFN